MDKREKCIRRGGVILCELFALVTAAAMLRAGEYNRLVLAVGTLGLVLLPEIMERLFSCRMSLGVYVFGLLYAIGPMLGHCWDLYYADIYWDKLLHIAGGVMFALVGLYLFEFLSRGDRSCLLQALFALCFSMALAVLWEFVEYGCDVFFHTDMQQDTLLSAVYSYLLGNGPGVAGALENIQSVVVDGVEFSAGGYVDIGLHDSMQDMLVETAGAAAVAAYHLAWGQKHPLIKRREK